MKDEISKEFAIDFDSYFADELARLEPFREDGLVLLTPNEIRPTQLGRIFFSNVAMISNPSLKQHLNAKSLFSKPSNPAPIPPTIAAATS